MPGTITIRPIEANLTHNTDLITKMNPYCSFIYGNNKFNSGVSKKGGKHPHWSDSVQIPTTNEPTLRIDLMDKDHITKDDLIGTTQINLQGLQSGLPQTNWYPLFYKNKPAGEICLETAVQGDNLQQPMGGLNNNLPLNQQNQSLFAQQQAGLAQQQSGFAMNNTGFTQKQENFVQNGNMLIEEQGPNKIFTEQHQVVEPHKFMKNVDVVETVSVTKEIEVTEPRKVLKDVEYTEAVPVVKQIEVVEPRVVTKEIETVEPKLVTKTIQVVENVPVKKQVEIVEMQHTTKEVETFEPQTFTKQVEVTEQVPVKRQIEVTEPVTVTKAVEFVEPVITTQTITKEVKQPVVVDQKVTTSVGPANLVGVREDVSVMKGQQQFVGNLTEKERLMREERFLQQGNLSKEELFRREHGFNKNETFVQPPVQDAKLLKEQKRGGFFLDH